MINRKLSRKTTMFDVATAVLAGLALTSAPVQLAAAEQGGAPPAPAAAPSVSAPDKAGIVWIAIPGGEFTMGTETGERDEQPAHRVRIKGFSLAKNPVTQQQWRAIMGTAPSLQTGCDDCPVTNVSWDDAQRFLEMAGKLTGEKLRLPTEAEWEYAAGGGEQHQMWAGTNTGSLSQNFGWFNSNSMRRPQPVCKKLPNLFGLCDMSGNVWEWCSDWYSYAYYGNSPAENPAGPQTGENRVLRGGCFNGSAATARVMQRYNTWPQAQTPYYGFRPAKD